MADPSGAAFPTNPSVKIRKRFKVTSIAGQEVELLTTKERDFYNDAKAKYTAENVFSAGSDFRTLDRLLMLEVQNFRAQWQLAAGCDYDGVDHEAAEQTALRRAVKETEALISTVQNDLSLTKNQRDRASVGAESVGEYIVNLKLRAKEHGIKRDAQIGKAIELLNELFAIVGSYKRSNENERHKLGFENADEILDWVTDVARPQYEDIDTAFRKNQKSWLRTL